MHSSSTAPLVLDIIFRPWKLADIPDSFRKFRITLKIIHKKINNG
jgi:hypothetical protein